MTDLFRKIAAALLAIGLLAPVAATWVPTPASAQAEQPMLLPVDPEPLVVEASGGEVRFAIEIADDDAERSAGLMFRRVMPDDRGMLFVFENTRRVSFWMKNTPMPLDLVFIDEKGIVTEIRQGVPYSTASIASQAEVRFVLEVKAGTAQKVGIVAGSRLRHPAIDRIAGAG